MVTLVCEGCGKKFERYKAHLTRPGSGRFCTAKCRNEAGAHARAEKMMKTLVKRFWARTVRDGKCLRWIGAISDSGYGTLKVQGKTEQAHRVAYVLAHGEIPDGKDVLHECDNRWCVEPKCLFAGTHVENMADMKAKGRQPVNALEANPNRTLNLKQVERIRKLYSAGNLRQADLANRFGIKQAQVSRIVRRKAW